MINNEAAVSTTTTTVAAPSTSSSNIAAQSLGLKNFFKTPEGRYKLGHDKCHPSSLLPYAIAKSITQVIRFDRRW
ncbi:hypothetical protein HanRHA438_Chr00c65g0861111 [Helianthus annuus]|nr:hypothetical protein HanHA300_Chr07g0252171 [Helianthus annuus]KAJ0557914.1 hypothetical protein HanIR_Chr07g0330511 [Helianthus annuus]KAJ0563967.1 hypothetical protein HanHA89_Chr07g0269001 [Helianthus annuus]KAJ0729300.1 hypothetical protein HanLR1_Chr07g0251361 [Helianthus annuus]KAJ0905644.1 hypothetical protein HanPSC8_Chr07g0296301 [Helianthus annuus]